MYTEDFFIIIFRNNQCITYYSAQAKTLLAKMVNGKMNSEATGAAAFSVQVRVLSMDSCFSVENLTLAMMDNVISWVHRSVAEIIDLLNRSCQVVLGRFTESNEQLARDDTEHGRFVFGVSFKHGVWNWSLFSNQIC